MNISFPGSSVLFNSAPSLTPAGFTTLGLHNYGSTPGTSGSGHTTSTGSTVIGFNTLGIQGNGKPITPPASSQPSVYQKAYDGIITASNAYLQNSLLNPPQQLPQYAPGSSAGSFAQLNTLIAQLKNGLGQGVFAGTGFNALA